MSCSAQKDLINKNLFGLSFGSMDFGTGDFSGYGLNIEFTSRLSHEKSCLRHFAGGVELSFDEGNEQPKVVNPSLQEFYDKVYYSTANIVFTAKVVCYPFNKTFAKGLNVS
jgi:hypothetical protein